VPLPSFDGRQPVVGSWIVGQEAAGVGIRESSGPITDNRSRFVPHTID
jgi:glutathionylspermidine synthase